MSVTNEQVLEAIVKVNQNVVKLYGALAKIDKVQQTTEVNQDYVSHNNAWGQANNDLLKEIFTILEEAKSDRDTFVVQELEGAQETVTENSLPPVTRIDVPIEHDQKVFIAENLPAEVTTEDVQKLVDSLEEIPDEPNEEEQNNEQETKQS